MDEQDEMLDEEKEPGVDELDSSLDDDLLGDGIPEGEDLDAEEDEEEKEEEY